MEYCNWNRTNELATKQENKFSVYISNGLDIGTESEDKIWSFVLSEISKLFEGNECRDCSTNVLFGGLFFFDTVEKARQFYSIFEQELTDSSSIYACLISPTDGCITENT